MMTGKENSAMTILMDFAKPCKGKLIGSVVLAVLGALCGMIPYIAVSRGIIMICHEDYAFSKLAFLALIAFAGYLGQVWFGTFSTMKSHESAFIILRNIRMAITEKLSRVPMGTILDTPSGKFKTIHRGHRGKAGASAGAYGTGAHCQHPDPSSNARLPLQP